MCTQKGPLSQSEPDHSKRYSALANGCMIFISSPENPDQYQTLYLWGVKQPQHEADHWSLSSPETEWSYTPAPPIYLYEVDRNTFPFTLTPSQTIIFKQRSIQVVFNVVSSHDMPLYF